MENKITDVYVWDPSEEMDTSLVRPDPISLGLFMQYHSIPEAYKIFSKESGVKKALLGEHDNPEFIVACIKTKAWVEGGCREPIPYGVDSPKTLKQDVLYAPEYVPLASQRVISVLDRVCPGVFEPYPISLNFKSINQFYIINLTTGLKEDEFLKNGMGNHHFCRLVGIEELTNNRTMEQTSLVLVSSTLMHAFREANIIGLGDLKYGERWYAKY